MRLDKFLSVTKTASRSEATKAARQGLITVNGSVVTDPSVHIDENSDRIAFNGREVAYKRFIWIMMNKPSGILSASTDKKARTVVDLLPPPLDSMGLFPCGRLDIDTVGLLLVTNDGPTAHEILSPKHHREKTYGFECLPLTMEMKKKLEEGKLPLLTYQMMESYIDFFKLRIM